jgi:hypothetical protein
MPGVTRYPTDPNSDEAKALDEIIRVERLKLQTRYTAAWNYYDGEHKKHLKSDGTQEDDNVILNKIGLIVDKGVSSLVGHTEQGVVEGVAFDIVDQPGERGFRRTVRRLRRATTKPSPAQEYLDAVWKANRRSILQHNLAMNGSVCGHVFVQLVPDGVIDTDGSRLPRLVNLDPANVVVCWDAIDYERVIFYRLEYGPEKQRVRKDIVRNDMGDGTPGWTTYTYEREGDGTSGTWMAKGSEAWKYDFAPIIDWQNLPNPNAYYGRTDVGKAGNTNDALNAVASDYKRILKHHSAPKTIGLGIKAEQVVATSVDGFWAIEGVNKQEADVFNLEMQSDLSSALAYLQYLHRSIFDQARELDPGTVQDKLGDLTNFGLRVLFGDNLGKVGTKRMMHGDGFRRLNQAILTIGNFNAAVEINASWPDPLPVDHLQEAQAGEIDRRNGMSQWTYLERRGLDPEQEQQRRDDEQAAAQESETVNRQGALADIIEAMGRRNNSNGGTPDAQA